MQEMRVRFLGREDALEKEMATHSSIVAWETPWTKEPGRLYIVHGVTELEMTLQLNSNNTFRVQAWGWGPPTAPGEGVKDQTKWAEGRGLGWGGQKNCSLPLEVLQGSAGNLPSLCDPLYIDFHCTSPRASSPPLLLEVL